MPLRAPMQGGAAPVRDRVAQAAQDIAEWQQRPTPELDHDGPLGRHQHRNPGLPQPHRGVGRYRSPTQFGDRLRVQAVRGGKGTATFLRRLALGSSFDRLRMMHAAAFGRCRDEHSCHSASSAQRDSVDDAPSHSGTEQLATLLGLQFLITWSSVRSLRVKASIKGRAVPACRSRGAH